ncbi:MAG: hypothetical protein LBS21_00265 [Clostridiales bacterium]|jgi:hypothetical protein|nr:hypothetical protein [Clostridiales bacterium]
MYSIALEQKHLSMLDFSNMLAAAKELDEQMYNHLINCGHCLNVLTELTCEYSDDELFDEEDFNFDEEFEKHFEEEFARHIKEVTERDKFEEDTLEEDTLEEDTRIPFRTGIKLQFPFVIKILPTALTEKTAFDYYRNGALISLKGIVEEVSKYGIQDKAMGGGTDIKITAQGKLSDGISYTLTYTKNEGEIVVLTGKNTKLDVVLYEGGALKKIDWDNAKDTGNGVKEFILKFNSHVKCFISFQDINKTIVTEPFDLLVQ